jgi:hypothetical protein
MAILHVLVPAVLVFVGQSTDSGCSTKKIIYNSLEDCATIPIISLILKDIEEGHLLIENIVNIFIVTSLLVSLHNLLDFYIL